MEATIGGPFPKSEQTPERHNGFFGVIGDPTAYGALMYMLLSLITGIFYFTWTVTGISLTAGFAVLIIGIPFALLFIGSVRVLSHIEGRIVESSWACACRAASQQRRPTKISGRASRMRSATSAHGRRCFICC